jgi:hypothetical protein
VKVNWVVKTNQGAFDRVVRHLSKMTVQAADKVGHRVACVYETENRQQCAAGCLIKTKWQRLDLNASGSVKRAWFLNTDLSYELVYNLQTIHDNSFYWNKTGLNLSGYFQLRETALTFNLNTRVLDKVVAEKGIKL